MAKAELSVILALREAVSRLEASDNYQWGHMGHCNCGFLAQVVTGKTAADIHAAAMLGHGDWSEQLIDFCPIAGFPMNWIIGELIETGFNQDDLAHLERLSDPCVLRLLPSEWSNLHHNRKEDVLSYLRAWTMHLEEIWVSRQPGIELAAVNAGEAAVEIEYSLSAGSPG